MFPKLGNQFVATVYFVDLPGGVFHRVIQRIAPIGRADNGATEVGYSTHRGSMQRDKATFLVPSGFQQSIVPFSDAKTLPSPVEGSQDYRPDNGI
jgi:hypothetical protein